MRKLIRIVLLYPIFIIGKLFLDWSLELPFDIYTIMLYYIAYNTLEFVYCMQEKMKIDGPF